MSMKVVDEEKALKSFDNEELKKLFTFDNDEDSLIFSPS